MYRQKKNNKYKKDDSILSKNEIARFNKQSKLLAVALIVIAIIVIIIN